MLRRLTLALLFLLFGFAALLQRGCLGPPPENLGNSAKALDALAARTQESNLKLALIGDGQATTNSRKLLEKLGTLSPDAVILLGDAVRSPRPGFHRLLGWQISRTFPTTPVLFLPGNRDVAPGRFDREDFQELYRALRFSRVIQGNLLIGLAITDDQRWVDEELDALEEILRNRPENIHRTLVFSHYPPNLDPIQAGRHLAEPQGKRFLDLCQRFRVDYLITGHFHGYLRKEIGPTRVLITGGGGAGLHAKVDGELFHALVLELGETSVQERLVSIDGSLDLDVTLLGNILQFVSPHAGALLLGLLLVTMLLETRRSDPGGEDAAEALPEGGS